MTWLFNRGTLLRFKLGNESADVVSFFVLLECGILLVHISILLNHGPVKFLFIDAKNWGRKWRLTAHHPHMLVHCPKNYLNICIKTESVTFRADASCNGMLYSYVCSWPDTCQQNPYIYRCTCYRIGFHAEVQIFL